MVEFAPYKHYYIHVPGLGSSCEHTTGEFIQNVLISALGFEEDTFEVNLRMTEWFEQEGTLKTI